MERGKGFAKNGVDPDRGTAVVAKGVAVASRASRPNLCEDYSSREMLRPLFDSSTLNESIYLRHLVFGASRVILSRAPFEASSLAFPGCIRFFSA